MTREPLPASFAASKPTAPSRPGDAGAGRDCDITGAGRGAGAVGTPPSALASPGPQRALPSTLGCCGRRYLKRGVG